MKNLLLALSLMLSFTSQATLIDIQLDQPIFEQGESISGQLVVSDFSYNLGGFAAELTFDPAQLTLANWAFGNGFDDGLGSYQFADDSAVGVLYLDDFADLAADLAVITTNQGTSFVLATFEFTSLSTGMHSLGLRNAEVVDFDNTLTEWVNDANTSFSVNSTQVPEPTTGILMLAGLMFALRRSK